MDSDNKPVNKADPKVADVPLAGTVAVGEKPGKVDIGHERIGGGRVVLTVVTH